MCHLVNTIYAGDALHGGLQLAERVYREVDVAYRYAVDILRRERRHREVELIRDAVDKVAHKVVAVDALDANPNRVEEVGILVECCRDYGVAILRGEAYDLGAVALMQRSLVILKVSDNLILGQWVTQRTAFVLKAWQVGKVATQVALGAERIYVVEPLDIGLSILGSAYLHAVAALQNST